MHIFPAVIGKLRRDITDDKEVQQDWDFPFIYCTINSVFLAFGCNANSNRTARCRWFRFPMNKTSHGQNPTEPSEVAEQDVGGLGSLQRQQ